VLDGGIGQADGYCAAEASVGALGGSYLALLSTSTASAWSRFDPTAERGCASMVRAQPTPRTSSRSTAAGRRRARPHGERHLRRQRQLVVGLVGLAHSRRGVDRPQQLRQLDEHRRFAGGTGVPDSLTGAWWDFAALGSLCSMHTTSTACSSECETGAPRLTYSTGGFEDPQ